MTDSSSTPPVPPSPSTSKLAIAGLVLGCCSLFCGLFTGFPAIICSVMALIKTSKDKALKGTNLAIAGLCLGCFSIVTTGILAGLMVPAVNTALETAQATKEMADGKQLAIILFSYANDHDGNYPPSLEVLIKENYLDQPELIYYPATKDLRWNYTPGLTTSSPAETILIESMEPFEKGTQAGTIKVKVDAAVEWKPVR